MSPSGATITVIATGGLANEPWVHDIAGIDVVDPTLTVRGLLELWREIGPGGAGARGSVQRAGAETRA